MSETWDYYFCRVNGEIASIFVDFSFQQKAPDRAHPLLLWIWADLNDPRPDGLTSNEEAQVLYKIEEALINALSAIKGLYVGRITNVGRREFYFYLPNKAPALATAAAVMALFSNYNYKADIQDDRQWRQYLDVLFPSPEAHRSIKNRSVLEALSKAGDDRTQARNIAHFAYFINKNDRSICSAWAKTVGFSATDLPPVANTSGKRWGLLLERIDMPDQETIDRVSFEIEQQAALSKGDYDGWECEVITGEAVKSGLN